MTRQVPFFGVPFSKVAFFFCFFFILAIFPEITLADTGLWVKKERERRGEQTPSEGLPVVEEPILHGQSQKTKSKKKRSQLASHAYYALRGTAGAAPACCIAQS